MSLLHGVSTVLFVHAHPDDETIATGALIAELVARGIRVSLLTATRGEQGEVVHGPLSGLEGTAALTRERERELAGAAAALGIGFADRFWLGTPPARARGREPREYRDSGMTWIRPGLAGPAENIDDDALVRAPLGEVTADLAALIGLLRPALVISYDNGGGYGHPDHVRMHDATVAASRVAGVPFAEVVHEASDGSVSDGTIPDDTVPDGTIPDDTIPDDTIPDDTIPDDTIPDDTMPDDTIPDDTIPDDTVPDGAEWFDLSAHLATVTAALRCHTSQLTVDGEHIVHSGGQRDAIITAVGLRRL